MATAPTERLPVDEVISNAQAMLGELSDLQPRLRTLDDYYAGRQSMSNQPDRLTKEHRELLDMSISNWCRLVVDVVAERLRIAAITSSSGKDLDHDAWIIFRRNRLDLRQVEIHTEALKSGWGFSSVWLDDNGKATVRAQSALQCHVRTDELTEEPTEGIKTWQGRDNYLYVTYWNDFQTTRLRSINVLPQQLVYTQRTPTDADLRSIELILRPDTTDADTDNPTGVVPLRPFYTQPDALGGSISEIEGIIPIQDRINRTTFNRLVAAEFHAFPQRWVTGIDIPIDPITKQPKEPFNSAVDRLWTAISPDTTFGQFPAMSPEGFLQSITADIQALATQSRTPPHYLIGGMGQFPSAESVRATEYGLHEKVTNRQSSYGESWVDNIRIGAKIEGNQRLAEDEELAIRWANVEARTEGEIADVLLKMATLGVPRRALWIRWGASPTEADEWERLLEKEAAQQVDIALGKQGLSFGQAGPPEARVEAPEPVVTRPVT